MKTTVDSPKSPKRDGVLSEDASALLRGHGLRAGLGVLREATLRLWNDEAMSLAGNIAFRSVLAMFPFLIFISSLTAFVGDQTMASRLIEFLIAIVPAPLVDTLVAEVRAVLTDKRGGVASIGILLTVWFAVGGVDSIRVGLNRAYDVNEDRSMLAVFVTQVLVVLGGGLTFVIVAFLLVAAPLVGLIAHRFFPGIQPAFSIFDIVRYPSAAAILMIALFAAHVFLPARRTRFSNMWPGVLFTVLVWLMLAIAFSWYLTSFGNYASYYAGIAGVIAALYFLYLAALVLIFGGEINRAIRIRRLGLALRQSS